MYDLSITVQRANNGTVYHGDRWFNMEKKKNNAAVTQCLYHDFALSYRMCIRFKTYRPTQKLQMSHSE